MVLLRASHLQRLYRKVGCLSLPLASQVSSQNKWQYSSARQLTQGVASEAKPQVKVPAGTQVVICGGGIIGCSLAYHISELGWKDVVLLEQGSIGCGTSWHAAGLIGRHKVQPLEAAIVSYSAQLYKELDEAGYSTGWKQCGALNLARSKDRVIAYRRALISSQQHGVEGEFLSPAEIKERWPYLNTDKLEGGYWIPGDGVANPTDVCAAFIKKAKENGVQVVEGCQVKKVVTRNRKVHSVDTDAGTIECRYFVNCAGQWARELGQLTDTHVRVPLHACEHMYIVTKPMAGISPDMPVVRDYDGRAGIYFREWSGGILGGGFEPKAKPIFHNSIPDKFEFQLLPEDWDHFQVLLDELLFRLPMLEGAEVRQLVNGPESFTPDGKAILGEAPEVQNYFIAAGMNSTGVASAGGIGKYLARWIVEGDPNVNIWSHDVRRFVDMHNNKKFLRARVTETLGKHNCSPPYLHFKTGRTLRVSPMYSNQKCSSGVFEQTSGGFERAIWYRNSTNYVPQHDEFGESQVQSGHGSFGKPVWFENVKSEYWACREGVCLIDMSTFSKFELRSAGREVVDFLQFICSNDIERADGMVVHTGMQNENGGYENDCSVVRLAHNHYFMISPTAQQTRGFAWLQQHLPKDGSVQLSDVTSMYTAINVIGPRAYDLLSELTDASLTKQHFFSMTCKEIDIGQASGVKAMRLTHSGEDGWMLYIPSEYALHVYDSLRQAGKNYGLRNAGYYALRALRTEKFFAYWGTDLNPYTTPMECGREYRVKFGVGNFLGQGALLRQREEGITQRLVQFLLDDHDTESDPWPWGGEPIYRNDVRVGYTTSTAYGFTLDRQVCLGYVQNKDPKTGMLNNITNDFILKDAKFEINVSGKKFKAKAGIYPPKLASAAIEINTAS